MSYVDCYLLNVSALQITYFFYTMFLYLFTHFRNFSLCHRHWLTSFCNLLLTVGHVWWTDS